MTTVLCTLYNSLYLDKGLVLYDSLCECAKDFKLYVLCMDDKCYEVLAEMNQSYHFPIRLQDFEEEDEALLMAKANRPVGEYCWTCSSSLIRFILKKYKEPVCTYIDADMYFYSDPQVLVEEMLNHGKSVMVTPHRFPIGNDKQAGMVGTYCVEFNTFVNNAEGLEVLDYWRNRCLDCCSNLGDGIHWGDQKYLDELVDKFSCVHICQNNGAGVAPWNIIQYRKAFSGDLCRIVWCGKEIPLIFYHFQSVRYITRKLVLINPNICTYKNIDLHLVDLLYFPYLKKIEKKKQFLENNYDISYLIKQHPAEEKAPIWKSVICYFNPKWIINTIRMHIMHVHPYIIDISNEE